MKMEIRQVSIKGDRLIVLTVPALANAVNANSRVNIATDEGFTDAVSISNFKMNVRPSSSILTRGHGACSVMGLVQSGKMRFDIKKYTLFKNIFHLVLFLMHLFSMQ